jgi:lipoyl(octanoyl) transferase
MAEMERRVAAIEAGTEPELFWLLEHPPLYTAGTSASENEMLDAGGLPVFATGRGGRTTYHGPGQRVIYALCDLRKRDKDLRAHVARLEEWIILTLADFGITGERRKGRIGIWVTRDGSAVAVAPHAGARGRLRAAASRSQKSEEKIAALGVRVRRWIAYHGLALNVHPDLSHYKGIVPCGLPDFGVTSMHALGVKATLHEVDEVFRRKMKGLF